MKKQVKRFLALLSASTILFSQNGIQVFAESESYTEEMVEQITLAAEEPGETIVESAAEELLAETPDNDDAAEASKEQEPSADAASEAAEIPVEEPAQEPEQTPEEEPAPQPETAAAAEEPEQTPEEEPAPQPETAAAAEEPEQTPEEEPAPQPETAAAAEEPEQISEEEPAPQPETAAAEEPVQIPTETPAPESSQTTETPDSETAQTQTEVSEQPQTSGETQPETPTVQETDASSEKTTEKTPETVTEKQTESETSALIEPEDESEETETESEKESETETETEEKTDTFSTVCDDVNVTVTLPSGSELPVDSIFHVVRLDTAGYEEVLRQAVNDGHREYNAGVVYSIQLYDGSSLQLYTGKMAVEFSYKLPLLLGLDSHQDASAAVYAVTDKAVKIGDLELSVKGSKPSVKKFKVTGDELSVLAVVGVQNHQNDGKEVDADQIREYLAPLRSYTAAANLYRGNTSYTQGLLAAGKTENDSSQSMQSTQSADQADAAKEPVKPALAKRMKAADTQDSENLAVQNTADPLPDEQTIRDLLSDAAKMSLELANARSTDEVKIVNLYADEEGKIDEAPLYDVINQEEGAIDVTDSLVVINIAADSADQKLDLTGFTVWNADADPNTESADDTSGKVLYNLIAWENGGFTPYTGDVTVKLLVNGTCLAPEASVSVEGVVEGGLYADEINMSDDGMIARVLFARTEEDKENAALITAENISAPALAAGESDSGNGQNTDTGTNSGAGTGDETGKGTDSDDGTGQGAASGSGTDETSANSGSNQNPAQDDAGQQNTTPGNPVNPDAETTVEAASFIASISVLDENGSAAAAEVKFKVLDAEGNAVRDRDAKADSEEADLILSSVSPVTIDLRKYAVFDSCRYVESDAASGEAVLTLEPVDPGRSTFTALSGINKDEEKAERNNKLIVSRDKEGNLLLNGSIVSASAATEEELTPGTHQIAYQMNTEKTFDVAVSVVNTDSKKNAAGLVYELCDESGTVLKDASGKEVTLTTAAGDAQTVTVDTGNYAAFEKLSAETPVTVRVKLSKASAGAIGAASLSAEEKSFTVTMDDYGNVLIKDADQSAPASAAAEFTLTPEKVVAVSVRAIDQDKLSVKNVVYNVYGPDGKILTSAGGQEVFLTTGSARAGVNINIDQFPQLKTLAYGSSTTLTIKADSSVPEKMQTDTSAVTLTLARDSYGNVTIVNTTDESGTIHHGKSDILKVTFSLEIAKKFALRINTVDQDGETVNGAVYAVYDADGNMLTSIAGNKLHFAPKADGSATVINSARYDILKNLGCDKQVELNVMPDSDYVPASCNADPQKVRIIVAKDQYGNVSVTDADDPEKAEHSTQADPLVMNFAFNIIKEVTLSVEAYRKGSEQTLVPDAVFALYDADGKALTDETGTALTVTTDSTAKEITLSTKSCEAIGEQLLANQKTKIRMLQEASVSLAEAGYNDKKTNSAVITLEKDRVGNLYATYEKQTTKATSAHVDVISLAFRQDPLKKNFYISAVEDNGSSTEKLLAYTKYCIKSPKGTILSGKLSDGTISNIRETSNEKDKISVDLTALKSYAKLLAKNGSITFTVSALQASTGYRFSETTDHQVVLTRDQKTGELLISTSQVQIREKAVSTLQKTDSIEVTKKLYCGEYGIVRNADYVFHVALYLDPAKTIRVSDVKAITMAARSTGNKVVFDNLDPSTTYYVGETNAYGDSVGTEKEAEAASESYYAVYRNDMLKTGLNTAGTLKCTVENHYFSMPKDAYYYAQLTISKILQDKTGGEKASKEPFYFRYKIDGKASSKTYDIPMNDSSRGTTTISIPMTAPYTNVEIVETNQDGQALVSGKTYKIRYQYGTGTGADADDHIRIDAGQSSIPNVTITNKEISKEEKETDETGDDDNGKNPYLKLTKQVTYKENAVRVNGVYYIGIFSDEKCEKMIAKRTIKLIDSDRQSADIFPVNLVEKNKKKVTLYFAEVDKDGKKITSGTGGYDISFNMNKVTLKTNGQTTEIICTNNIVSGGRAEQALTDPTSGFAGDSTALADAQAGVNSQNSTSKTGDSTPILPLAAAAGASLLIIVVLLMIRRKKK